MNWTKNLFGNLFGTRFVEWLSKLISLEVWEGYQKFDDRAHQHREFIRQYTRLR